VKAINLYQGRIFGNICSLKIMTENGKLAAE